jgi:magnesium-transporting ATPase (P-type)
VQVICVDKTGTLTTNAMAAVRAATPTSGGIATYTMSDATGRPSGHIRAAGASSPLAEPASVQGLLYMALCAAVCSNSSIGHDVMTGEPKHVGDSTEVALRWFSDRVGLPPLSERQVP